MSPRRSAQRPHHLLSTFGAIALLSSLVACEPPGAEPALEAPSPASESLPLADRPWLERDDSSGLDFVHRHGGTGERYMMETMGSGLAVFDADDDGHQDVYFVQSGPVPWEAEGAEPAPNRLYRNLGNGTFEDITDASGAGDTGYGMGACAGDVTGDGAVDLFITNFGPDALYRNRGDGTFENITDAAGLGDPRWSAGCAFADIDRDGDLDLFVVHYVDFDRDNHQRCGSNGAPGYCHPDVYDGVEDSLWRNRGDGTFEDITATAGLSIADPREAKGLGVQWIDADDDGLPDAYVANDSTRNFLWRNRGDGTFEDVATLTGTAFNARGQTEAGMGIASADVDGDAVDDLYVTHLDAETNTLYRASGGGLFRDATNAAGLGGPSLPFVGFGAVFFDLELDGDPDLFVANGHIIDNVTIENPNLSYAQRDQLYRNDAGRFTDGSADAGPYFNEEHVGRGAVGADLDNDGDLDLVISNSNTPAVLLWNRAADGSPSLCLDLRVPSGAPAIGARVVVADQPTAGAEAERNRRQTGTVYAGSSYLSQNDPRLCFAVAAGSTPSITIRWPNGASSTHDDLEPMPGYRRLTQPVP